MATKRQGNISTTRKKPSSQSAATPQSALQLEIDRLLKQEHHQKALDAIQKALKTDPNVQFTPSVEEITYRWGIVEFHRDNFRKAEDCFSRVFNTSLSGEGYYWYAKSLIAQNCVDAALKKIKEAFETKQLPKNYAICYLKLLLLKGEVTQVEALITTQAKRFTPKQLDWAKGALALKAGQLDEALAQFQKIKTAITPGDEPLAWILYTHQAKQDWPAVQDYLRNQQSKHGIGDAVWQRKSLQPIAFSAIVQTIDLESVPKAFIPFSPLERSTQELLNVIICIQATRDHNFTKAGKFLLRLTPAQSRYPELAELRVPLLKLAGQEAMDQHDTETAQKFWSPLLNDKGFDPQLAVNLFAVQEQNEADRENQRLLTRLLKWVEDQGKQNRDQWPEARLKPTLADIRCRLSDTWIALGKYHTAVGEVRQAERIAPNHPEVIGRKGLLEVIDDHPDQGIVLMTQALEAGCKCYQVYHSLLQTLDDQHDRETLNEIRRKFGQKFGDLLTETEESMVPWIEAISIQHYHWFMQILKEKLAEYGDDPALKACEIFQTAVGAAAPSVKKVSFDRTQATKAWDRLLKPLSPEQQIPTLQAIILCIHIFAKAEKGLAAIVNQYLQHLETLAASNLEAQCAYLTILIIRNVKIAQVEKTLPTYLSRTPQPGTALAKIQLMVRCFSSTQILAPFLDNALKQESQNAQLLLAKATLYPEASKPYQEFCTQGFELARRLQDQAALKAFRQEKSFLDGHKIKSIMPIFPPSISGAGSMGDKDLEKMLENMARSILGSQVPPEQLENLINMFSQEMMGELPNLFDLDDEDKDNSNSGGFSFPFGNRTKSRKSKR